MGRTDIDSDGGLTSSCHGGDGRSPFFCGGRDSNCEERRTLSYKALLVLRLGDDSTDAQCHGDEEGNSHESSQVRGLDSEAMPEKEQRTREAGNGAGQPASVA